METAEKGIATARRLVEVGQPAGALEALERISGGDLENPEIWELRAHALYDLERYPQAERAALAGLEREPESIPLLLVLCNVLDHRDDLAGAERALLTALELEPDDPILLARYAHLCAKGRQLDKAERLVEAASARDPDQPYVRHARALLAYLLGRDKDMAAESRAALAEDPEDVYSHMLLGAYHSDRGALTEAARRTRTAAGLDPADEDVVAAARTTRAAAHWILLPLRPLHRLGWLQSWFVAVALLIGLRAAGYDTAAMIAFVSWWALCIFSWVVPPLVQWWVDRRAV